MLPRPCTSSQVNAPQRRRKSRQPRTRPARVAVTLRSAALHAAAAEHARPLAAVRRALAARRVAAALARLGAVATVAAAAHDAARLLAVAAGVAAGTPRRVLHQQSGCQVHTLREQTAHVPLRTLHAESCKTRMVSSRHAGARRTAGARAHGHKHERRKLAASHLALALGAELQVTRPLQLHVAGRRARGLALKLGDCVRLLRERGRLARHVAALRRLGRARGPLVPAFRGARTPLGLVVSALEDQVGHRIWRSLAEYA
jgi:hypothetical protein